MTKASLWRRRKFLVNRDLQYGLLLTSFFHIFLFLALVGLGLFTPLFIRLGGDGSSAADAQQAASVLLYLHANFWPSVLISFVLIGLFSLRASHKIAGPLFRISFILKSVTNGSLPAPRPSRKGDQLMAELAAANGMLEKLRSEMSELQDAERSLHDAISACAGAIGRAPAGEITELMDDVREKERLVAERLGYFKVVE
jgi:hypothetical protein